MREDEEQEPQRLRDQGSVEPRKPFYMKSPVVNVDGTINIDVEGTRAYDALQACMNEAKEDAEGGEEVYVYEVRPIYRLTRGAVRVQKLKTK